MTRAAIGLLLGSLVLSLAGCSGGGSGPQAAFDKYKSSMAKKDFETAMSQLTPESQALLLSQMLDCAELIYLDPAKANTRQEVDAVLEKHRVKAASGGADFGERFAAVQDKPGCARDLQGFIEKHGPAPGNPATQFAGAELTDVKISGDMADAKTSTQPLKFKQVNGVWLIDLAASLNALLEKAVPSGALPGVPNTK